MFERHPLEKRPGDEYGHGANPFDEPVGMKYVEAEVTLYIEIPDSGMDESHVNDVLSDVANISDIDGVHIKSIEDAEESE